jgi:hypothetical protein
VEQTDTEWPTVLEKNGLSLAQISLRMMGLTVRPTCPYMLPSSLNTPAATALLSSNSSHNFFSKKRQSGSFLSSPFCHLSITNTSFLPFMSTPTSYILPPIVFVLSFIINKVRIREHLFAPSRTHISRSLPIAWEQRPNIPHTKRNPTWVSPFARAMGQDYPLIHPSPGVNPTI